MATINGNNPLNGISGAGSPPVVPGAEPPENRWLPAEDEKSKNHTPQGFTRRAHDVFQKLPNYR